MVLIQKVWLVQTEPIWFWWNSIWPHRPEVHPGLCPGHSNAWGWRKSGEVDCPRLILHLLQREHAIWTQCKGLVAHATLQRNVVLVVELLQVCFGSVEHLGNLCWAPSCVIALASLLGCNFTFPLDILLVSEDAGLKRTVDVGVKALHESCGLWWDWLLDLLVRPSSKQCWRTPLAIQAVANCERLGAFLFDEV